MRARRRKALSLFAGILAGGVAILPALDSASAQGIFELLFGGFRRQIERSAPPATAFVEPFSSLERDSQITRRAPTIPSRGFCVRTCDGRYFPVQAAGTASAADMCRAFCPASDTQVYSGSTIDYATARDGSRYDDLATAFLYRERFVNGCTCNGRDAFGLAHINIEEDPTLKRGDIVVTKTGLVAYSGTKNKTAEFTPVSSYGAFSKAYRDKLSEMQLMPPNPGAPKNITSSITPVKTDRLNAQLNR